MFTSTWEVLEQSLHSGLSEFFPGKAKQRKLDLFAESTRGLLKQRKELKKQLDQLDEWDFASMQRLCLRAWKDEAPFIYGQLKGPDLMMQSTLCFDSCWLVDFVKSRSNSKQPSKTTRRTSSIKVWEKLMGAEVLTFIKHLNP